jgi:hypothetical protein
MVWTWYQGQRPVELQISNLSHFQVGNDEQNLLQAQVRDGDSEEGSVQIRDP